MRKAAGECISSSSAATPQTSAETLPGLLDRFASDLTVQPQRHRCSTHAESVRDPLMALAIRAKLLDLDHVCRRDLLAASDLDTFST